MLLGIVQAFLASFSALPMDASSIESEGRVELIIEPGKVWWVWHNATFWFAQSQKDVNFAPGDWVKVVGRKGLTLLIERLENTD